MARPSKPEESWMIDVADIMVKENLNFRRAAESVGKFFQPVEAQNLERTKAFQRVLWTARNRYFEELGSDPQRTRAVLLGQAVYCNQKLMEEGNFKDTLDGIAKLFKMEYGTEDTSVNVFANLNQSDIDAIKAKLKALQQVENAPLPDAKLPS